ncbi:TlpA disulfide reductase family protein [Gelidibacter japonicus]|uniref:TlpA family protein disulfide reductase n=1 Tax=Gelidibacter japonicus TaxID=1962232 RepID=UPI002AFF38B7|nr:TlpA disulfide reductase family protein [Gelidibacter japonicus]
MKKLLIVLTIATITLSCKNEVPNDLTVFSGEITNIIDDKIILANHDNSQRDTIAVSEAGKFLDTLKISTGSYLVTYGKIFMRVHLEPASHLNITFDTKDFKNSLNFSGEGAAVNTYLQDKIKREREMMGSFEEFYSLDEVEFKKKANDIKTSMEQFIDDQMNISDDFKKKENRNIGHEFIAKLLGYEKSHSYVIKVPEFKVSTDFLPEMTGFDYNNSEDFNFSGSYRRLVSSHFRETAKNISDSENLEEDVAYLKVVSESPNQEIKNKLLFDEAKSGISYTANLEDYYDVYMKASTDKKNNEIITESYHKLRTVAKGMPSPKFFDYENNDGSKTSLDDLKGKYIYVDVWATWCGPCIKEIPSLKRVEKEYHGKNIEFLSVSIDKQSDHGKWKKMIVDENLGGIQVLADNAWESQFVQDYLIMGIPRFILLDPEGNIVTANAPRPSDDKLIDLFNELNI